MSLVQQTAFVGTRVRITGSFELDDAPLDPGTLVFRIRRHAKAAHEAYTYGVDEEIVRTEAGEYYFEILLDTPGVVVDYRWESTDEGEESAQEGRITVPRRDV